MRRTVERLVERLFHGLIIFNLKNSHALVPAKDGHVKGAPLPAWVDILLHTSVFKLVHA